MITLVYQQGYPARRTNVIICIWTMLCVLIKKYFPTTPLLFVQGRLYFFVFYIHVQSVHQVKMIFLVFIRKYNSSRIGNFNSN